MTAEQCRAKVAELYAEAERLDLDDARTAFRANAAYLLQWADEVEVAAAE